MQREKKTRLKNNGLDARFKAITFFKAALCFGYYTT
jgi:hypothetical protein